MSPNVNSKNLLTKVTLFAPTIRLISDHSLLLLVVEILNNFTKVCFNCLVNFFLFSVHIYQNFIS